MSVSTVVGCKPPFTCYKGQCSCCVATHRRIQFFLWSMVHPCRVSRYSSDGGYRKGCSWAPITRAFIFASWHNENSTRCWLLRRITRAQCQSQKQGKPSNLPRTPLARATQRAQSSWRPKSRYAMLRGIHAGLDLARLIYFFPFIERLLLSEAATNRFLLARFRSNLRHISSW